MAAGGAGGGAGAAGFAALDQWQRFGQSQVTASRAYDRQKNMMTRGPTYMMKGLRDAGINPILAAGGGILGNKGSPVQQAHATGAGQFDARSLKLKDEKENIRANTKAAEAAAQKSRGEALLANVRAALDATDMPRKAFFEQFFSSQEGHDIMRKIAINEALPNTAAGLVGKTGYDQAGGPRSAEIDALIGSAASLPYEVQQWLQKNIRKFTTEQGIK